MYKIHKGVGPLSVVASNISVIIPCNIPCGQTSNEACKWMLMTELLGHLQRYNKF